jgi:hypothetical protein
MTLTQWRDNAVIPACFWRESSDFAVDFLESGKQKALDSRQKHAGMTNDDRMRGNDERVFA